MDRIIGIIGPNGSGKTTLFNIVAGVHKPTGGRVLWKGRDITGKPAYQIARMGVVRTFQQAMSYPGLSLRENVRIACEHGRSRGGAAKPKWDSPDEILDFVGLAGLGAEMAGSMPFGNLRRLGVAVALGANPLLLRTECRTGVGGRRKGLPFAIRPDRCLWPHCGATGPSLDARALPGPGSRR